MVINNDTSTQKDKNAHIQKIINDDIDTDCNKEHQPEPYCPHCNSSAVYGMSRVVGYFSIIENWNRSKQSELKRRRKGNYWHDD